MTASDFGAELAALQAGDEGAWARVYVELAGPVLAYLRFRGARDAEDLTGEVFFRVARGIGGFTGDAAGFRSWVFTIAHHQLLDDRRREVRTPSSVSVDEEIDSRGRFEMADTVESEVVDRLGIAAVTELVEHLTSDQREVFLLRVLGGFNVAETAEIVGKDPNAVKQLQHRAVGALQRLLARDSGDSAPEP